MKWSEVIESVSERLSGIMPETPGVLKKDLEKNFRAVLEATFNRLDLVTREEFDIQTRLLTRCRERIAALEEIVRTLESGN